MTIWLDLPNDFTIEPHVPSAAVIPNNESDSQEEEEAPARAVIHKVQYDSKMCAEGSHVELAWL